MIDNFAKIIVFTINLLFFLGSAALICYSLQWQKSILEGVRGMILSQPIFALLMISLILYPIMYLRKTSLESKGT